MTIDFTVAIPTYNGEDRIGIVLERLRLQVNTESINWEIIVIDNHSNDRTSQVIYKYQKKWQLPFKLIYVFEARQGLAFARQRAIKEARGEFVGFLDDDNLPSNNWVIEAYKFGKKNPHIGAYSGHIHANFEIQPPANFKPIFQFLAIREHGDRPRLFKPDKLQLPPGAGLVIRQQAWHESVPNTPVAVGNIGQNLARGDDYEPLLYLHKAGWEIWYNPSMHINHQIPPWRLEREYLLSLAHSCGLATCQLLMINAKTWQKPIIFCKTILGSLHRIITYSLKYRGQFQTNLVAAFELRFFLGSMLSPFYLLRKSLPF